MINQIGYEAWYKKFEDNQAIANPIDTTIEGMKALLADDSIDIYHKEAAAEFLRRTQSQNNASILLAVFCSLGAAFSSMAYFLLIRDHSLDITEWEYLIVPTIVGLFVALATWYTYRHDTAEWMLGFSWEAFKSKHRDYKDWITYLLTFMVVSMEIALSGYGVMELGLGESETTMVVLVCLAALLPEWAQTHKYLDKWVREIGNKKENEKKLEDNQHNWLRFYQGCSVITLVFWGMAIFPLIEDTSNTWVAAGAIAFYVVMGKPYMHEKAHEQVRDQFETKRAETEDKWAYPLSRIGNGIGDLAFSAYGFFETLKAFGLMAENAKPLDSFDFHGGGDETTKTWLIMISAVIVVGASCVGSFLMSAGGDQKSYGSKINEAKEIAKNKSINDHPPPSAPVRFTSMWHNQDNLPKPQKTKNSPSID